MFGKGCGVVEICGILLKTISSNLMERAGDGTIYLPKTSISLSFHSFAAD